MTYKICMEINNKIDVEEKNDQNYCFCIILKSMKIKQELRSEM